MLPIKLIIGLANPGERYHLTRHNAGEWFVHRITPHHTWHVDTSLNSRISKQSGSSSLLFAIPTTYINLSGQAVQALSHYYKIASTQILIAHDDIDLPTGSLRLKQDGGHGGHNGLRHIMQLLGTQSFWRLRIGVGRPPASVLVEHYVLHAPTQAEKILIETALTRAQEALPWLIQGHFQAAMNFLHTTS
jgi:PTH1 family peptidyl-tRNA hydrolase